MVFRERPQGRPADEPVGGDLLVICREIVYRQTQVIQVVELWEEIGRLLQTDLRNPRLASGTFDVLQHRIQDGPSEVRFRVRQSRLVVRAGRLAQSKVTFPL